MLAIADKQDPGFVCRDGAPFRPLLLFWGTQWKELAPGTRYADAITERDDVQEGRLYLGHRASARLLLLRAGTPRERSWRELRPEAMRILQRHGVELTIDGSVPVGLPATGSGGLAARGVIPWLSVGLATTAALLAGCGAARLGQTRARVS